MKDNPRNPRKITVAQLLALKESLKEFGDLSGIVENKRTGKLVGGHQRLAAAGGDDSKPEVRIIRAYPEPTPAGTLMEGRVQVGNEELSYRLVDWDPAKEAAAMIAANKHGGSWDETALAGLLSELKQEGEDLGAIGITEEQEERLAALQKALKEKETSEKREPAPQIKMVHCFVSVEQHIEAMRKIAVLRKYYGTRDITATIVRALELEAV